MIQRLPISRNVTRFGLIRHAATRWNRQRRIQGQKDSALTRDGELSAARWGRMLRQLPWHRILASDTGRAVKTAELVNGTLNLPMETDPRLRGAELGDMDRDDGGRRGSDGCPHAQGTDPLRLGLLPARTVKAASRCGRADRRPWPR